MNMENMRRISMLYHAQQITKKEAVMLLILSANFDEQVTLAEEWLSSDPELLGMLDSERDHYLAS